MGTGTGSRVGSRMNQSNGSIIAVGRGDTDTDRENSLLSFFIPDLTLGGAEQDTVNIVNGLAERGYKIELLVSKRKGHLKARLENNASVVELTPSNTSVFGVGAHPPALVNYFRRKRPVALFSQMAHVSVVCLVASTIPGTNTAIIPTQHNSFGMSNDSGLKGRIIRGSVPYLYPLADQVIAVSEGVANSMVERAGLKSRDISVLHNPIHVDEVRERSQQHIEHEWLNDERIDVILFVGRIEEQKNLTAWLQAFKQIHERNPDTRAIIAGKGSRRQQVTESAERLDIDHVVSMPGYVENPYAYMRNASVFLLSSRFEGLPTVLIEALACGCPVVATDCPSGPREILADGRYGTLAPVGDINGLVDGVIQTLADPIPVHVLEERADDFAPESVLDDYEQFLEIHVFQK